MPNGRTFKAFFSYAHIDARADSQLVEALTRTLEDRVNVKLARDTFEIWRDTEGLRTGDRWDPQIEAALRASDVLIVLLTPRWLGSDYCRREYRTFEAVERGLGGEFVAPLLARPLGDEERHLTDEARETWASLQARQYKPIGAVDFLKLDPDDRIALVDRIADDLMLMIGRRRARLAADASKGAVPVPEAKLDELQRELSKANEEAERRHREMLAAIAREKGVPREQLEPILAALGHENVPLEQMAERLREAVDSLRAKAAEPVRPSNEGADVDKAIRDAREKLGDLDAGAAIAVLDKAMAADEAFQAAARRRATLLEEKADIQRRSFDLASAGASLEEAVLLDPDRVRAWIRLGEARQTLGSLASARAAFENACRAADRTGDERLKCITLCWLGDVLRYEGDRPGALAIYYQFLATTEALVSKDPGNTEWQRDLSVSSERIGDVLRDEGDRPGALAAYRKGLTIREALAAKDPGNTEWQRDLSVSHNKIGDVLRDEGDRPGALVSYRKSLAIRETLAAEDPDSIEWQRDLSVSHNKIGDVLRDEGDRPGALAAYRKALAISESLATKDPGNTEWQRDLSISHNRIGDVLRTEGGQSGARAAFNQAFAIIEALVAKDPGNTEWQRDLIITCVKMSEAEPEAAKKHLAEALRIATALRDSSRLAPVDAWMPGELERRLAALDASSAKNKDKRKSRAPR